MLRNKLLGLDGFAGSAGLAGSGGFIKRLIRLTGITGLTGLTLLLAASAHAASFGKGCTSAWYIDEDCDGYGPGVRSNGLYGIAQLGLGDRPDADDTDSSLNTAASVRSAYDANSNGRLDTDELKSFLSVHKGITPGKIYYVSPNGNNATGLPNNPDAPYATYVMPPAGSTTYGVWQYLQPGDVVVYLAGAYDEPSIGGGFPPMKSGVPGNPIVVMAAPGEQVKFTVVSGAIETVGAHDVIVDGFQIDNPNNTGLGTGISFGGSTNVILRHIELQRFNYVSCINDMHSVTVEKWVVHHNAEHGLYMGARELPSSHITVKDSVLYANGVESGFGAIQYNGRVTDLRIERNILHSNGQWGVSLKQGVSDSLIQNNVIFNNQGNGIIFDIYPGDCATGGYICPYSQTGNRVLHNTIWIGKYNLAGVVPIGNTPAGATAILLARNVGTIGDSHDQGNNTFQNNILVTYNGPAFRFITPEWLDRTWILNNVIYRVGGSNDLVAYGNASYSFSQFETNWASVMNNTFADPLLEQVRIDDWGTPENFKLDLLNGSPAIGYGSVTGAPTDDLRRAVRSMPPDAGAYDFAGPGGSVPSSCDLNNDNQINVGDVQVAVNQAIGVASCTADLNGDGLCNVVEVQRIVNAALGGQCVTN